MKIKKIMTAFVSASLLIALPGMGAFAASTVPKPEKWTTLDSDFIKTVPLATEDRMPIKAVRGMQGFGAWKVRDNAATYTHTDGKVYNFTQSLQGGSGGEDNRCFYFKPKQACIVTVVYASQAGRPMKIYQGGELLAAGEEGIKDGQAAHIWADIEDPADGDVYIYGGSSNKDLFGIFVDYYDPSVITTREVSGKINYSGKNGLSDKKLVFFDTKDGTEYTAPASDSYTVNLRQNRNYEIYLADSEGNRSTAAAVTLDTDEINLEMQNKTLDISLVDIEPTVVTGDITVHEIINGNDDLDLSKVTLTFTPEDDTSKKYTAEIKDNSYSVTLMPDKSYTITAENTDGFELSELSKEYILAAGDTAPFKNILIKEVLNDVPFEKTVNVGKNQKYSRINDAVTAIKKMIRPEGEDGRVTILVDSGEYKEQVLIDAPYVTIKAADENDCPVVSWYYGIGYLYYSAHNGYYDEDYAAAKAEKGTVTQWGPTCRMKAEHICVENVIFKNTLNCEVAPEEIADGVEAAKNNEYSDVNGKPERTVDVFDAMAEENTERGSAIAVDADYIELYKCDFVSSQDTFYTNGIAYVKDCYIEGSTDYIFGGNSVVFDGCTLAWHGYTSGEKGGHITANKNAEATSGTPNEKSNGYLLRNCTVTTSKYYPNNRFASGSWGRNWGGEKVQVVYDGVKVLTDEIPSPWVKMNGELTKSVMYVENVTDKNGNAIDTTEFNPNGTMTETGYTEMTAETYLCGWKPPHYISAYAQVILVFYDENGKITEVKYTDYNTEIPSGCKAYVWDKAELKPF